MSRPAHERNKNDWTVGEAGPLDLAVLFIDLVSSSEFASVMGLRDYAEYVETFQAICERQCRYFFEVYRGGAYDATGLDYEVRPIGDELAVFMHTNWPWDDIYQLVCLAITIKCAWLGCPLNAQRLADGMGTAELAAGIHYGKVWAHRAERGFAKQGFAINVAKRVESASREGDRFRVFVSDPAYKLINRRMRNLIFGPRRLAAMKGVVVPIGVHELIESFVGVRRRLAPEFHGDFERVAGEALAANTFDLWIHSCLQVWSEERHGGRVTDVAFDQCKALLKTDPRNPVALYYAAQAARERDDPETALLYLEDLTRHWPSLADGWLELARCYRHRGDLARARQGVLQARRHGARPSEESLPEPQTQPSLIDDA